MVDIITACHAFIQSCKTASFVYNMLIDKTVQLIEKIGSIELSAAKACLNKARSSNDKKEEISRAITMMLMARGKLSSSNEEKFQTTLLIAMCYHFINEFNLSRIYSNEAIEQFNEWIDCNAPRKNLVPAAPIAVHIMGFAMLKANFVSKIKSIGLEWKGDTSISEWRRESISANRDLQEGIKNAREDFSRFVKNLFS